MTAPEIEDENKLFAETINAQATDSLKVKLLKLFDNHNKRNEILEKGYNEEFYDLEFKYGQIYNGMITEISKIVNADTPIPHYWKKALENAKFFPINDKDKEILKFLTDVTVKFNETEKKNITFEFHFLQNAFFDHTVLTKSYKFDKKEDTYTEATATEIFWKGEAPNLKIVKKKIKKGKNVSVVTKEKKVDSFFNYFENYSKSEEKDEKEDDPEDVGAEIDIGGEADFILNDLLPFSMEYYLDLQKFGQIDDKGFNMAKGDEDEED